MCIHVKPKSGLWLMPMSLVGQLCHSNIKCFILELCDFFETGSHFVIYYIAHSGTESMAILLPQPHECWELLCPTRNIKW